MWLVDNYKLFFLRVPKTGSHTIYRTFNGGRGYKGMHGTMGGVYKNDKNLYNEISKLSPFGSEMNYPYFCTIYAIANK